MRIYAIGDIHGQRALLEEAHARIAADQGQGGAGQDTVVHLGDLVDRGPDSRGVLDLLMAGIAEGRPWVVLRGNHDRMFAGFLDDPDHADPGLRADLHWFDPRLGGEATLMSYGVGAARARLLHDVHQEASAAVPAAHRAFLRDGLVNMWQAPGIVFVHAGIRPGVPLDAQREDDLLWIRGPFLDDARDHGALVVHGHTPVEQVTFYGNRLNLDTGAGYGRALSTVVIEEGRIWELTATGRVAVTS